MGKIRKFVIESIFILEARFQLLEVQCLTNLHRQKVMLEKGTLHIVPCTFANAGSFSVTDKKLWDMYLTVILESYPSLLGFATLASEHPCPCMCVSQVYASFYFVSMFLGFCVC